METFAPKRAAVAKPCSGHPLQFVMSRFLTVMPLALLGALLIAGFAALFPIATSAATTSTVFMEELTWTELQDEIKNGKTTIIVPIGGTEQNGPHMALGKHNLRVKVLAEKIAQALGSALVAPVVAYVPEGGLAPPTAHMRFPGTITIPAATFESLLESAGRSFKLHGFRDIVFLGDHGGYQKEEAIAADRLNREWSRSDTRAHAIEEYYLVTENTFRQALKSRGYTDAEIGTHAGVADTSLTLAVTPQLVRIDRMKSGVSSGTNGVAGDPRRASAELGRLGVEAIVGETVAAIRKAIVRRHS